MFKTCSHGLRVDVFAGSIWTQTHVLQLQSRTMWWLWTPRTKVLPATLTMWRTRAARGSWRRAVSAWGPRDLVLSRSKTTSWSWSLRMRVLPAALGRRRAGATRGNLRRKDASASGRRACAELRARWRALVGTSTITEWFTCHTVTANCGGMWKMSRTRLTLRPWFKVDTKLLA